MDTGTQNEKWARKLIDALIAQGIDYFCCAPGSRSTTLSLAIANHPQAKWSVHFDERGLAFHALGYAKTAKKPAVVIATSGTAIGNLMPAVMEAHNDRVPLIILSADRPPELRDCGANQTVDQVKLFNNFVRWQVDLPCPDDRLSDRYIASTISHAIAIASYPPSGPVHINCMFREPLFNAPLDHQPLERCVHIALPQIQPSDETIDYWAEKLSGKQRGIIIVGSSNQDLSEAAFTLAEQLKWPVFADILSTLRSGEDHSSLIVHYDPILKLKNDTAIDAVIQFGDRFASKTLALWLEKQKLEFYLHVADQPMRQDPTHLATHRVISEPASFSRQVSAGLYRAQEGFVNFGLCETKPNRSEAFRMRSHSPSGKGDEENRFGKVAASPNSQNLTERGILKETTEDWQAMWNDWDHQCKQRLAEIFSASETLTEPGLVWEIASFLSEDWNLFLANSMPVRDANQFFLPISRCGPIFGNRGVSGIDGNLATACGLSRGNGKPTLALIGDLTFLHDINSLALIAKSPFPIVICIVNNGGGGIFSFLPVSQRKEAFEEFIAASHEINFEAAGKLFDLPYFRPQTPAEFGALLFDQEKNPHTCLIEITTDRTENLRVHEQIIKAINTCLNSADSAGAIPANLH